MNSLSWFLYFADVLPSFASTVTTISIVGIVLGGISLIGWTVGSLEDKTAPMPPKSIWGLWASMFLVLSLGLLIPSKETIYLIAGSEAGETVVSSEVGQEMLNDIHEVIKHQLDQLKGDE